MSTARDPSRDPEQIRELQLLKREYEAQMLVSCDPSEKRRLYAVMKQLDGWIVRAKSAIKFRERSNNASEQDFPDQTILWIKSRFR
jgi:hypothetical protein